MIVRYQFNFSGKCLMMRGANQQPVIIFFETMKIHV